MKKIVALVLALVLALSITACGKPVSESANADAESDKIKVVYIGKLGDNSFNDTAWAGLQRAAADFGVEATVIEPATTADFGSSVVSAVNSGADMVLIFGGSYADTFNEYCARFPEVYFGGMNSVSATPADNLVMAATGDHEGSFLAGALAAMVSKTNVVGAIGGMESDAINRFLVGYEEGAKYINPDIKVLKAFVGSFEDPAKAKEFAQQLHHENADVIYHVAGGSGMGVFEAAKEIEDLYAIGVDTNQDSIVPGKILTSMVKTGDQIAYDFVKMVVDGNFQSGTIQYGVSNGGVSLTDFAQSKNVVTDEMIEKLEEIKGKIESGEIKVTDLFQS